VGARSSGGAADDHHERPSTVVKHLDVGRSLRSMLDKEVDIVLSHEEFNAKTYARVAYVNRVVTLAVREN